MRIGFIVDGESEREALPHLLEKIETEHELLRTPLKAGLQPYGSADKAASAILFPAQILAKKGADLVVVLIDREKQPECSPAVAQRIASAIRTRCDSARIAISVVVVVKDRQFENWLVADPEALAGLKGRFQIKAGLTRSIQNRADAVDAIGILKAAVKGDAYDKVRDAERIMKETDPLRMASNSRSFRRFLRVVGHPSYRDQSRRAAGR